jgi:hypothetical protein
MVARRRHGAAASLGRGLGGLARRLDADPVEGDADLSRVGILRVERGLRERAVDEGRSGA